jgi:VWFA-related protein
MRLIITRALFVCGLVAIATHPAASSASRSSERELFTLTVAVVDDDGRPVSTLARDAFTVREDGRSVPIESFRAVSAGANGARRGLVVLLDDANVSPIYTVNIKAIAKAFLAKANAPDLVSVTSLSHRNEELTPELRVSSERIGEFQAGSIVAQANETFSTAVRRLTNIARELAIANDGRNTIVCVGPTAVFDIVRPPPGSASLLWAPWVDLIHVLAHTGTSLYLIDPTGLTRRTHFTGGLVSDSGGHSFVNSNDFTRAVDRIWSEAGHYYVLEYAPSGPDRVLHSIDVAVRGRGLHVHALRYRGDYHENGVGSPFAVSDPKGLPTPFSASTRNTPARRAAR